MRRRYGMVKKMGTLQYFSRIESNLMKY